MAQTYRHKRALRAMTFGSGRPRASRNLRVFQPMVPVAKCKLDELIARQATVTEVYADRVVLQRHGQFAQIDAWGRVRWGSSPAAIAAGAVAIG